VIGAGSVVLADVASGTVVAGVPARELQRQPSRAGGATP
jgi:serine acetyltransferase